MNEKRIVVDTNVIISGLLGEGPPAKIIDAWILGLLSPVVSQELKREINEVLQRPNIKKLLADQGVKNVRLTLGILFNKSLTVIPKPISQVIFSDKNDHFLYELAVTSGARTIVTGDKALLQVKRVANIEILTPAAFCQKFKLRPKCP